MASGSALDPIRDLADQPRAPHINLNSSFRFPSVTTGHNELQLPVVNVQRGRFAAGQTPALSEIQDIRVMPTLDTLRRTFPYVTQWPICWILMTREPELQYKVGTMRNLADIILQI